MPPTTRAVAAPQPAWPTLLGIQVVLLAALAGLAWRTWPRPAEEPPPLEQRLLKLDVPAAMSAVDGAIADNRSAFALTADDERHLSSFLALTADAARLEVLAVRMVDGEGPEGLDAVDAVVALRGDLYDLPVFVDAVHLQRAAARIVEITALAWPGGSAEMQVRLRFIRPAEVETGWIAQRLATAAPGCDRAAPVLERAAVLASWRGFAAVEQDLVDRASDVRHQVAVDLPIHLVSLRRTGGQLTWVPDGGVRVQRRRG